MADTIIKILEPAESFDFMTLDEAKLLLGISSADTSSDEQLKLLITQYSDVIMTTCNRIFAREKVRETWRDLQSRRIYLSHWPVREEDIELVESPRGTLTPIENYYDPDRGGNGYWELEEQSGKLEIFGSQVEPIEVTYTGGYNLPDEAPPALKNASTVLIRAGRSEAARESVSGIRSIAHKDSRVMFFDGGGTGTKAAGGGVGTSPADLAKSLLYHYMRFWV